ncbi:MAG: hypothetical protein QM582_14020 [Micropruina sp.]|uniref:hypothetical protein n=1 Tax=Micropruina sp. TaxID=2737536 RepID=UPI0039E6E5C8
MTRGRPQAGQLDLFGEDEAKEARRQRWREWNNTPQTCPLCHRTEPTGFLLSNNHLVFVGPDPEDQRLYTTECSAMRLSRNHVLYWFRPEVTPPADQPARDIARARERWAHRLDDLRASLAKHGTDLDELP